MKSVLRCQNKPKSADFSIIGLLIDSKKSEAAGGPLRRPEPAFSRLSISQCFDFFQSRKIKDGAKTGDVIRWSVFDLPPRFASNSFFAFDLLFIRFFSQLRGYPEEYYPKFTEFLRELKIGFDSVSSSDFVNSVFEYCSYAIEVMLFTYDTGNPIFLVIKLAFATSLLYVVYRVIKCAISKV